MKLFNLILCLSLLISGTVKYSVLDEQASDSILHLLDHFGNRGLEINCDLAWTRKVLPLL